MTLLVISNRAEPYARAISGVCRMLSICKRPFELAHIDMHRSVFCQPRLSNTLCPLLVKSIYNKLLNEPSQMRTGPRDVLQVKYHEARPEYDLKEIAHVNNPARKAPGVLRLIRPLSQESF
jgi:hypothetical protein